MVTDPVCGAEIDPEDAMATSFWLGHTYYFCSLECKEEFDLEPTRFAQPVSETTWYSNLSP